MKRYALTTLALLPLLLLTGCFETDEEFTLNPDGSGKVAVTSLCAPFEMETSGEKKTPEQKLQDSVKNIFDNTKGVTAWRDVSYERQDDGRLKFKGTAYFADLNKLNLNALAIMEFTLVKTNGGLVLSTQMKKDDGKPKPVEKLSEAELTAKIKEARASFQSSKPMLTGFLSGMRQNAVFHLPGAVSQVTNFKQPAASDVQINFAGTNMITAMESLVQSDDWWRKQFAAGGDVMKDGLNMDDEFNEKLFGQKAPVRAVVAMGAAKFDYAAELAVAKKEFAVLEKKLDARTPKEAAEAEADAPSANGGDFKSLKVAGIRWVFPGKDKDDFNMRAFNEQAGWSVAVIGELPGAVLEVGKGEVTSAIGADGSDLLPEDKWQREIHFPRLSKDRTQVLFEAKVGSPGPAVKGFKEIAGTLEYTVGTDTTNVDLGVTEIKAGAKGTALGATVKEIKPSFGSKGGQDIVLELDLSPSELISMTVVAADGSETPLKQNGYGGNGHHYTITFQSKSDLPASARLVAKIHSNVKRFEIPFKLSNLDLMGQSTP